MCSGTYSEGSATRLSGKSGKSRSNCPIAASVSETAHVLSEAPPPPPTVLVVSETAAYHHASIPAAQRFLRSLPGLHVVVLARVAQLTPARLRGAAAVVFASTSGSPPFSATGRRALLRFVRDGGAFVGLHAAGATYPRWAGYGQLIGTRFRGHAPFGPTGVVVTDRADAITRGLPARLVTRDESYRFTTRPRAHVMLAADAPGR